MGNTVVIATCLAGRMAPSLTVIPQSDDAVEHLATVGGTVDDTSAAYVRATQHATTDAAGFTTVAACTAIVPFPDFITSLETTA